MKNKVILTTAVILGLTFSSYALASDWGQVQEAGRLYYQAWKSGDKAKTAETLKEYERLAAQAHADENSGKVVPTTLVKTSALTVGKKLYDSTCSACHSAGVLGAPKLGDKAAWAPRIERGQSILIEHALSGFQGKNGTMPPKGGSSASDEDVKAAVQYMVSTSK